MNSYGIQEVREIEKWKQFLVIPSWHKVVCIFSFTSSQYFPLVCNPKSVSQMTLFLEHWLVNGKYCKLLPAWERLTFRSIARGFLFISYFEECPFFPCISRSQLLWSRTYWITSVLQFHLFHSSVHLVICFLLPPHRPWKWSRWGNTSCLCVLENSAQDAKKWQCSNESLLWLGRPTCWRSWWGESRFFFQRPARMFSEQSLASRLASQGVSHLENKK